MFYGTIVAIVTPFTKDNRIDETKLRELVEFQIQNGINGIVPMGTTGESPTLTPEEHARVVEIVVDAADKRVPIIAGTGSNSTAEAIQFTRHAEKAGADGALVVTPYYNKPTQEGLYRHFKAVADSVKIPIILYNIESRTGRNIETPTVARLAKACKNIVGVKEASGSLDQAKAVKEACGEDFVLLSGDDALTIPIMELGGKGVISVAANIIPKETREVTDAMNAGDTEQAKKLQKRLLPLIEALFIETNPVPVKAAMEMVGLCSGDVRLPLCEMEAGNAVKLRAALENSGLFAGSLSSV